MTFGQLTNWFNSKFPLALQESYDNSGLIVGEPATEITGVLVSLDCTEAIVEEAIAKGCNLIVAHHPIVFKGLKKLNGKNYVERTVMKAIKNDVGILALHTNVDNHFHGVNRKIAELLNLQNVRILQPIENKLVKLSVFIPNDVVNAVSNAIFEAGGGEIGNYAECSFQLKGTGTFTPNDAANPFVGEANQRTYAEETKTEFLVQSYKLNQVLAAMKNAHPYEEVAYEIYPLLNENQFEGAGMIGELEKEMDALTFLKQLKETFNCGIIRHTELVEKPIKTVALCGGSGSFLLSQAKQQKADIFITGDFKYHEFFDAENQLIIADIGHYESEQFTSNLLADIIKENFTKFAVHLSDINTNPINYF